MSNICLAMYKKYNRLEFVMVILGGQSGCSTVPYFDSTFRVRFSERAGNHKLPLQDFHPNIKTRQMVNA